MHFNKEGDVVHQSVHVRVTLGLVYPGLIPLNEQKSSTHALACTKMALAAVFDKLKSKI